MEVIKFTESNRDKILSKIDLTEGQFDYILEEMVRVEIVDVYAVDGYISYATKEINPDATYLIADAVERWFEFDIEAALDDWVPATLRV